MSYQCPLMGSDVRLIVNKMLKCSVIQVPAVAGVGLDQHYMQGACVPECNNGLEKSHSSFSASVLPGNNPLFSLRLLIIKTLKTQDPTCGNEAKGVLILGMIKCEFVGTNI